MLSYPHFICIGAQKGGTRWLYDQAKNHPRVWMPPIKELRYFHEKGRLAERATHLLMRPVGLDARDLDFLRRASRSTGNPADIETYRALFEPAGGQVSGDISPAYAVLPEPIVSIVTDGLPTTRFIYLVRDPIERLWSQVNMLVRHDRASNSALVNQREFKQLIDEPRIVRHSFPSRAIKTWRAAVNDDRRFRVFRMTDLVARPAEYRRAVFEYLDLDAGECKLDADYNAKQSDPKKTLPESFKPMLADYFGREYEDLERLIGTSPN